MKKLIFLSIFIPILGFGQIPTYYSNVNLNLSGAALKNELSAKVINTHTNFLSYTPGVWNALKQTDLDPSDSSKVLLVYGYNDTDGNNNTDRTRSVNNNGGSSGDWNREHVYPKSLGNPNLGTSGPGADAHHLRPADTQRNSSRGSRKFGDGNGNSGANNQGYWYPGDEWKGDVARMMMYMYIRYGNRCLPKNVGVGTTTSNDSNMLNLFLEWNAEDPVSQLELQRNPVLENLQGNRNPFIDNPAFATQIWGGPQAEDRFGNIGGNDMQAPTNPSNLLAGNTTQTTTTLSWNPSSDNVGVTGYDIYKNGSLQGTFNTTTYNVTGLLVNTTYSFFVRARDAAGNISGVSNTVNVTTQSTTPGGDATELFFSEYIEGSSNNKALEIANFTGASVNLSGYSIKRQTNGSGSWSAAVSLSGSLTNGQVYVVANNSASTTVKNKADLTTSASAMTFNGNDPVGLFKNGVLIDIVGTFNGGSSNFAKDVTLRRKSNVSSPSTIYAISQWVSFSQNTFVDLGEHTFGGGDNSGTDTQAPNAPSNLTSVDVTKNSVKLTWGSATDNIDVIGYRIYKGSTLLTTTVNTAYEVINLSAGNTYVFKVYAYDAAGNISEASNSVSVTTEQDTIITYCESKGNTVDFEYIDFVQIGNVSNTTQANAGYGDFTNQIANLSAGSNSIVVSAGFASNSYEEKWAVWIDFNQNGTFETSEKVVNGSSSSSSNLNFDFNIPTSTKLGTTRMRVSMKWNGIPSPCETFGYGEVEDYIIRISASSAKSKGNSSIHTFKEAKEKNIRLATKVFPNPATTYLQLDSNNLSDQNHSFTLRNIGGSVVRSGKVTQNKISLDGVEAGSYLIRVSGVNNKKLFDKKIIIK